MSFHQAVNSWSMNCIGACQFQQNKWVLQTTSSSSGRMLDCSWGTFIAEHWKYRKGELDNTFSRKTRHLSSDLTQRWIGASKTSEWNSHIDQRTYFLSTEFAVGMPRMDWSKGIPLKEQDMRTASNETKRVNISCCFLTNLTVLSRSDGVLLWHDALDGLRRLAPQYPARSSFGQCDQSIDTRVDLQWNSRVLRNTQRTAPPSDLCLFINHHLDTLLNLVSCKSARHSTLVFAATILLQRCVTHSIRFFLHLVHIRLDHVQESALRHRKLFRVRSRWLFGLSLLVKENEETDETLADQTVSLGCAGVQSDSYEYHGGRDDEP